MFTSLTLYDCIKIWLTRQVLTQSTAILTHSFLHPAMIHLPFLHFTGRLKIHPVLLYSTNQASRFNYTNMSSGKLHNVYLLIAACRSMAFHTNMDAHLCLYNLFPRWFMGNVFSAWTPLLLGAASFIRITWCCWCHYWWYACW